MARSRHLLGSGWAFKQKADGQDGWLPVPSVPSQVHMDLLANKKIPDPYLDLNELAVQWVGETTWVYRLNFPTPAAPAGGEGPLTTDLVFDGLDTFATVSLNGTEILKADNMFVSHRVNVSELLAKGKENVLDIEFASALLRGRELVKSHQHEHDFFVRQSEVGRVPVRKAQYNWGWDWGPILMTAGIWRPVYLEQYVARIDDVWVQYELSADLKTCKGTIFAKLAGSFKPTDKIAVALVKDNVAVFETECSATDLARVYFELQGPQIWFPFGYGAPARYELTARLLRDDSELDSQAKLVGFRRAELIQEKDTHGKSFYFRVNGIDIFAGGSCWIPGDNFLSQISRDRYRDWAKVLVDGNQIMVRVWGGGIYEDDAFIEACDEFGVLVWHDFQFACASYPTYPSYLESVELEARQNIRRLRSHPSVVIWAGTNEDYQVQERYQLDYDFENKDPESWLKSTFPARYIYEHLLPKLVGEEGPSTAYHPCSPWGDGKPTADPTVGDIHQWNIWHGAMNKYQEAGILGGRFVSEFGMEAYPHLETICRMVTNPSQRYPGSMTMDFHNKAIDHERRLVSYVAENFRIKYDLASFTHLSQLVQAETMRYVYKTWRRQWGRAGDRECGGVLVWQLNDCWPTMSWAVVDYYLVKKPAFYAIKRAMRQLDIGVSRTLHDWVKVLADEHSGLYTAHVDPTVPAKEGAFDVWVASSLTEPTEASLTARFISIRSGKELTPPIQKTLTVTPNGTTEVIVGEKAPTAGSLSDDQAQPFDLSAYDPYVIHVTLAVDGRVVAADSAWPQPLKYLDFSDRDVKFEVSPAKDEIKISAAKPVMGFVFEEVEGMHLSDNGFDIVPGEKQVVTVEGPVPADQLLWTYLGAPGASLKV